MGRLRKPASAPWSAPVPGDGFADIFEGNAFNSGLLPIELPMDDWKVLAAANGAEATIDLQAKTITVHGNDGDQATFGFDVPEENRQRLLQGLDFISETLLDSDAISRYERQSPKWALTGS